MEKIVCIKAYISGLDKARDIATKLLSLGVLEVHLQEVSTFVKEKNSPNSTWHIQMDVLCMWKISDMVIETIQSFYSSYMPTILMERVECTEDTWTKARDCCMIAQAKRKEIKE